MPQWTAHDGGPSWLCSIVVGVLGVCSICLSFYFFAQSAEDPRSVLVHDYDAAVEYWSGTGLKQFSNVTCTVASITGVKHKLNATAEADTLKDSDMGKLTTYTSRSYVYNGGGVFRGLAWTQKTKTAAITLVCQGGAATQASEIALPATVALYKTDVVVANQKQCRYQHKGSYVHDKCEVYRILQEVCVKLSLEKGQWRVNNTWGGSGCHAKNQWSQVAYKQIEGSSTAFGHGTPPTGPVDFSKLQVRVRSGTDPWLMAENLTNDSLDFGATSEQDLFIAICLFILGSVFMAPLAYRCIHDKKKPRSGLAFESFNNMMKDLDDDVTNPLHHVAHDHKHQVTDHNDHKISSFGGTSGRSGHNEVALQML